VQAHSKGQAEPKSVQIQGQGHPLLEALSGFATVGLGDHAVPTAVVAGIPPAAPRAAQGSAAPTLHNAGLSRAPIVK
jgi:hypothetical protein